MILLRKLNSDILLYIGMILVVLNAIFLDSNLFLNILGFTLILFSSDIAKILTKFLKDDH